MWAGDQDAIVEAVQAFLEETGIGSRQGTRPTDASDAEDLGLTPREREVLRLVAQGYTNKQIAAELFISAKTAGAHVSNILSKMAVERRVEAATMAERLHLFAESPAPRT